MILKQSHTINDYSKMSFNTYWLTKKLTQNKTQLSKKKYYTIKTIVRELKNFTFGNIVNDLIVFSLREIITKNDLNIIKKHKNISIEEIDITYNTIILKVLG